MIIPSSATSLAVLLARVKTELDTLTRLVGDMQTSLSPLLIEASSSDPEMCRHVQDFDLVWQTLDSLSQVMSGAAAERVADGAIDLDVIVHHLPLADLAARLKGTSSTDTDESGDLDLF